MIKVYAMVSCESDSGKRWVNWRTITDEVLYDILPVSLARVPDHCYFHITKLHDHDSHVPMFTTVELIEQYISRVRDHIVKALSGVAVQLAGTQTGYNPEQLASEIEDTKVAGPGHEARLVFER